MYSSHYIWSPQEISTDVNTGDTYGAWSSDVTRVVAVISIPRDFNVDSSIALCLLFTADPLFESFRYACIACGHSCSRGFLYARSINSDKLYLTAIMGYAIDEHENSSVFLFIKFSLDSDESLDKRSSALLHGISSLGQ